MEQQQKFDFGIIGGGVYGLSIAYHLAKSQKTVALFERYIINNADSPLDITMVARMDPKESLEVFMKTNFIEI